MSHYSQPYFYIWDDLGPFYVPQEAKSVWEELGPFRHPPRVKTEIGTGNYKN